MVVTAAAWVSNLACASYTPTLASRNTPSRRAVDILIGANLTCAIVCAVFVGATFREANDLGLAHVALEGLFVSALARIEYRQVRPYAR